MPKSTIWPVLLAALLLAGAGGSAHAQTPAQFSKLIQDDLAHWGALIKAVGAKLD